MKQVIWKYKVEDRPFTDLQMPGGAEILSVAIQENHAYIWALVNPNQKNLVTRRIHIIGTGHPFTEPLGKYIGTIYMDSFIGPLVWHYFDGGIV